MSFNAVRVRVGGRNATKVVASNLSALASITTLGGLVDVDTSNKANNYVLSYNTAANRWEAVDPDQILSDAAADGSIPGDFINILDTDTSRTDNIDFDGGQF